MMTKQEIETTKKKFGENLQRIRKERNMSLLQVSYNCSLLNGRISEIEHGKHNIRLATILELAKGLEIEPSRLLDFK
ncbi:MAG TPA: helix-turn-helix transcriptional regulator [Chitinophagaceae bacterium]